MNPVKAIGTSAVGVSAPANNAAGNASKAVKAQEFAQVLQGKQTQAIQATQPTPASALSQREQAIAHFYEIHQRSQITGVPTAEYNAAVAALGLDATKDPFAAIAVLQEAGYEAGSPSLGAILKYGSAPQASGNQSYLAQAAEAKPKVTPLAVGKVQTAAQDTATEESAAEDTPVAQALLQVQAQLEQSSPEVVDQRPDPSAVTQEIQTINQQYGGLLGSSGNYFEAVKHLSTQVDITPYLNMTLDQALPMIAAALETNQLGMTTDRWLLGKG